MKMVSRKGWVLLLLGMGGLTLALLVLLRNSSLGRAATWQRQVSPGPLAAGHAFLENNCAACHTAVKGADASKCITCHANNQALLQRQPTAFHGHVGSCVECHAEHGGIDRRPINMDHAALAKIGLRQLRANEQPDDEGKALADKLRAWTNEAQADDRFSSSHPGLTPSEAVLNCAACHGNKDRHQKFFGQDCAQCHSTAKWTISEFRHPSAQSTDCAQCHPAPPSHYMGHFHMVSAKVAGKPHAKVNQCFLCHQTTSWNDIKGVGWYKHH